VVVHTTHKVALYIGSGVGATSVGSVAIKVTLKRVTAAIGYRTDDGVTHLALNRKVSVRLGSIVRLFDVERQLSSG